MIRNQPLLIGALVVAGVVAVLAIGAVLSEDEPTQADADQQFCDDLGVFEAALGDLRDVDKGTPISEFEDTRENVRIAYDNMIASAEQVRDVRLDDFQEANDNLKAAVDDIDDDATLQEARGSIKDEADEVSKQISQMLNDVNCGSGQGGQERSDE